MKHTGNNSKRGISAIATLSIIAGVIGVGVAGSAAGLYYLNNQSSSQSYSVNNKGFDMCDYFTLSDMQGIVNNARWTGDVDGCGPFAEGISHYWRSDENFIASVVTSKESFESGGQTVSIPYGYYDNVSIRFPEDAATADGLETRSVKNKVDGIGDEAFWYASPAVETDKIHSIDLIVQKNCLSLHVGIMATLTGKSESFPSDEELATEAENVSRALISKGLFDKSDIVHSVDNPNIFLVPRCL